MLQILIAGVLVLGSAAGPVVTADVRDQPGCPPDIDWHRRLAARFLTDPDYADFRAESGMTGTDPSSLRVLTDSADLSVCRRIDTLTQRGGSIGESGLGPYVFYRAGNRYIVVSRRVLPPGQYELGWSYLVVLDDSFNVVAGYLI